MKVKLLVEAPNEQALIYWLRQAADTVEARSIMSRAQPPGLILESPTLMQGTTERARGRLVVVVP